jgi:hypothetical protein
VIYYAFSKINGIYKNKINYIEKYHKLDMQYFSIVDLVMRNITKFISINSEHYSSS